MIFPDAKAEMSHILVVSDSARSKEFYVDILGAQLHSSYDSTVVVKFLGNWLVIVEAGGPTQDKPGTDFVPPADIKTVSSSFTIRVGDCHQVYNELKARGVSFVTPPVTHGRETRAFFTDLDNHLYEISEYSQSRH